MKTFTGLVMYPTVFPSCMTKKIGIKKCPDLYFRKTFNYRQLSFETSHFRGKLLILDLESCCLSCLAFSKIDSLQKSICRMYTFFTIGK